MPTTNTEINRTLKRIEDLLSQLPFGSPAIRLPGGRFRSIDFSTVVDKLEDLLAEQQSHHTTLNADGNHNWTEMVNDVDGVENFLSQIRDGIDELKAVNSAHHAALDVDGDHNFTKLVNDVDGVENFLSQIENNTDGIESRLDNIVSHTDDINSLLNPVHLAHMIQLALIEDEIGDQDAKIDKISALLEGETWSYHVKETCTLAGSLIYTFVPSSNQKLINLRGYVWPQYTSSRTITIEQLNSNNNAILRMGTYVQPHDVYFIWPSMHDNCGLELRGHPTISLPAGHKLRITITSLTAVLPDVVQLSLFADARNGNSVSDTKSGTGTFTTADEQNVVID